MDQRIPVDPETSREWVAIAHQARIDVRVLEQVTDPDTRSNFDLIDSGYPQELASTWHRSYLKAALEHLVLWAELIAPLKFHPEQETIPRLRPTYTLGRAALESASHAVWLSGGGTPQECVRRHLRLVRWDYREYAKSIRHPVAKQKVQAMDEQLLTRVSEHVTEDELRPPSLLEVLRGAAEVIGAEPDNVERVWRAASGATHGKYWPTLVLQHVVPIEEYEPGQLRTLSVPDTAGMTEVLELASEMTSWGVLRHVNFSGRQIQPLLDEANHWLASVVPLRDDADPKVIERLLGRTAPGQPDGSDATR